MSHPLYHAKSSARKHGGDYKCYLEIHNWFDETKAWIPDVRHRAFRHHAEGIFQCEKVFGVSIKVDMIDPKTEEFIIKEVPVRLIGEQHVIEDCGFIPSAKDYFKDVKLEPWQRKVGTHVDVDLEKDLKK